MARRGTSVMIDINESVKQLENELRILNTRKQSLLGSIDEVSQKRDKVLNEYVNMEAKIKALNTETKEKSDKLIALAEEKFHTANEKDAVAAGKVSELNDKIKDAENLIKSNLGTQKNLGIQGEEIKNKIIKLEGLVDLIQETLKDM